MVSSLTSSTTSLILIYPDHNTPILVHILSPLMYHHPLVLQRVDHSLAELTTSRWLDLVSHERVLQHRFYLVLRLGLQIAFVQVFHVQTVKRLSSHLLLVMSSLLADMGRRLDAV